MSTIEFLVVGAGFAGSVLAQELAVAGKQVVVIDKREHTAGNAFDYADEYGVWVHKYGPHIFHTNNEKIWNYLSRFTQWSSFELKVKASVDGLLLPLPINRTTINMLYGLNLDEAGALKFLESVRIARKIIETSEDVVYSSVGYDLGNKFFKNYIRKQWGMDMSQIKAEVAARIPTRTNEDDRYFSDKYQGMPTLGYSELINNLLNHKNIKIELGKEYNKFKNNKSFQHVIYTGPIDEYFGFKFGQLPYRSLRFEFEHFPMMEYFQCSPVISYPNDNSYTRITEFKRMTGQMHPGTTIAKEYPESIGDPYYPVPTTDNQILYSKYLQLAKTEKNITFVGRLAQYKYFNMDQVVAAALVAAKEIIGES